MRHSRILEQEVYNGTWLTVYVREFVKVQEHHEAFENHGAKRRNWNMSDKGINKL